MLSCFYLTHEEKSQLYISEVSVSGNVIKNDILSVFVSLLMFHS